MSKEKHVLRFEERVVGEHLRATCKCGDWSAVSVFNDNVLARRSLKETFRIHKAQAE